MQIQPTNNFSNINRNQNQQFKSVYSVVHWLAETNGSYAPVLTDDLSRKLNGKLVRVLNSNTRELWRRIENLSAQILQLNAKLDKCKDKKEISSLLKQTRKLETELASCNLMQRIKRFITRSDSDYADCPYVRAYYNRNGGIKNGGFEPIVYLLTGKDAIFFEEKFGKPIGKLKQQSGLEHSAELQSAKADYWLQGVNYVKKRSKQSLLRKGVPQELHIKAETIRNRTGKIKGYNIVDMKYFPTTGEKNPFVITGIL